MEKITKQQAIELIDKLGDAELKAYFNTDLKADKSAVQTIVEYVKQTKDEEVYLRLVRSSAKFADYIPFMRIFPVISTDFLTKQFLANPDVLNTAMYSSQAIKRIKDEWNKNTCVTLTPEMAATLEDSFYAKREKEKQAKNFSPKSNTNGRVASVSSYDKDGKTTSKRYVQRGGAITTAPVYGGQNKR